MRRLDLGDFLAVAVMILGICCLLLVATGFAESSLIPASVRHLVLTWVPFLSMLCIVVLGIVASLTAERVQATMSRRIIVALGLTGIGVTIGAVILALTTIGPDKSLSQFAPDPTNRVRIVEGGGISVQAELQSVLDQTLEFEIILNTHSVDVTQFDLGTMSRVVWGTDQSLTGATWTPQGDGDSHHVGGLLTFRDPNGVTKGVQTIILEIVGLPGGDVRRFEWQGAP